MNIYLDTNILVADPFFKSSFSQLIIKSASENSLNLYIPNICLKELFSKLTHKARTLDNDLKNKVRELNRWTNSEMKEPIFDLEVYEKRINHFYREKLESRIFIELNYKTEFFTENLEKAIKSVPPFFSDKKEEFRDGLIWSTVREHSYLEKNVKNYLLTANYADFWNFEKTDLHPSLKKESDNILIVDSFKNLFEIETSLIDFKKSQEFKQWIDEQKITIDSIQSAINRYLWNHIAPNIDAAIKRFPIKDLKSDYEIGYISADLFKQNFKAGKIEKITPVEDFATLEIIASLKFDGKLFLPNYERGDFSKFESLTFIASLLLTISYDKDLLFKPLNISITKIEIE